MSIEGPSACRSGIIFVLLLTATSRVHAAELSLALKLDRTEIRFLDPLFAKVILTNRGGAPIVLPNPLGTEFDTLRFEIRQVGKRDFRWAPSVFEPGGVMAPAPRRLDPKAMLVSYELIAQYPEQYGFPGPGEYELRVRLRDKRDATTAASAVQAVRVLPVQPDEMKREMEAVRLVTRAIKYSSGGVPFTLTKEQLAAARDELGDSPLKNCLDWLTALAEIRDARHPEQIDRARARIEAIRAQAGPVVQEHIARVAALQYIHTRRWEWAREEIARLKGRDYTFNAMELQFKEYLCPPARGSKSDATGTQGKAEGKGSGVVSRNDS